MRLGCRTICFEVKPRAIEFGFDISRIEMSLISLMVTAVKAHFWSYKLPAPQYPTRYGVSNVCIIILTWGLTLHVLRLEASVA